MTEHTAKINSKGSKMWYLNGELHREDGPAVEHANGSKMWYLNDELHREGGPAVEDFDGFKAWYQEGKRHREGGPAVKVVPEEYFTKSTPRKKLKLRRGKNVHCASLYH